MNLAVISFFRNSGRASGQARRFMGQVGTLQRLLDPNYRLRVIAVWGDSKDDTEAALRAGAAEHNLDLQLVEHHHRGPVFGSTEAPERLRALSKLGNAGLNALRWDDERVLYVESDLLWQASVVEHLLNVLETNHEVDVVAPLVMAGDLFYDVWAFRKGRNPDGSQRRFSPFPPFFPELNGKPLEVDSMGSCLVMHGSVARTARMHDYGLVDFCASARFHGFHLFVDPRVSIHHP